MSAIISNCGRYRYRLDRAGEGYGSTAIIMVNPSTADAETDDHTIRKLRGFGKRNGWGRLIVGNLFAYRATDVRELGKTRDPVGLENDEHLRAIFRDADIAVFAWGPVKKQPKYLRHRWGHVRALARETDIGTYCIGPPAKCGHPKHPLMLNYQSPILPWSQP